MPANPESIMLPALSLYVHMPWCVRKCPYCDFNSHESTGALPEKEYVDALLCDLDGELAAVRDRSLISIFFGGGTPSLFSGAAIERLLDGIRARLPLSADIEITLEANPGTAEAGRFKAYRAAGVNRLSIGVQSFRDEQLRALGRIHDAAEVERAWQMARAAGFDNINLDLMYALPGERDAAGALADLNRALDFAPEHLSWYQLTLEPDTAFHRKPPALPDEDVVHAIEERGRRLLAEAGYRRYEVSAYARAGRSSRHNLNYWQFGDYLGIGAGAHGKLTAADGVITRRAKQRNPRSYMKLAGTLPVMTEERIASAAQITSEFMMNALRLCEGVPVNLFEERTGLPLSSIQQEIQRARELDLLERDDFVLRPTARGRRYLNDLIAVFAGTPAPVIHSAIEVGDSRHAGHAA
ncbi:MAG TPA: radical SAM family heme chaperone HemW [Gammaproteobacteria bacterium]|nr:radical SAM family heme chaperone HemW [Gammaproteobacteria bacterium]